MTAISTSHTQTLLQTHPDPAINSMARDAELVTALTAVLNVSLEISEEVPRTKTDLAIALTKKSVALSSVAASASGSKNLELANFATSQTLKTVGLIKIVEMTPARATAFITLTMAEKVVSAAGLGQLDKCHMAVATLTVSGGAGVFVCAGSLGIGCIASALAFAADAFNAYAQCTAPNRPAKLPH